MSKYDIDGIVAILKSKGLAYTNLYEVSLSVPNTIKKQPIVNTKKVYDSDYISVNSKSNLNLLGNDITQYSKTAQTVNGLLNNNSNFEEKSKKYEFTNLETVTMLCNSAQIPFFQLKEGIASFNHRERKFAIGLDTNPISMTFMVDKGNIVMRFFTQWYESIYMKNNDNKTKGMMNYKNDYSVDCYVTLLSPRRNNTPDNFLSANILKLYPTRIEPISLQYGNSDIIQLKVDFNYDDVNYLYESLEEEPKLEQPQTNISELQNFVKGIGEVKAFVNTTKGLIRDIETDARTLNSGINTTKKQISGLVNTVNNTPSSSQKGTAKEMVETAKNIIKF